MILPNQIEKRFNNEPHWNIIMFLDRNGEVPVIEMKKVIKMKTSTFYKSIERLEELKIIKTKFYDPTRYKNEDLDEQLCQQFPDERRFGFKFK